MLKVTFPYESFEMAQQLASLERKGLSGTSSFPSDGFPGWPQGLCAVFSVCTSILHPEEKHEMPSLFRRISVAESPLTLSPPNLLPLGTLFPQPCFVEGFSFIFGFCFIWPAHCWSPAPGKV